MKKFLIFHVATGEYYLSPDKGTTRDPDEAYAYDEGYINEQFHLQYLLKVGKIILISLEDR